MNDKLYHTMSGECLRRKIKQRRDSRERCVGLPGGVRFKRGCGEAVLSSGIDDEP